MITLENEFLKVGIELKGAELISVFSKKQNHEYMWQADPRFWAKTSPVLFPIVGGLINDNYFFDDQQYQMSKHGFARDQFFNCISETNEDAIFSLEDTDQTRDKYPFAFTLKIVYKLQNSKLSVSYIITNKGDKNMPYSIGAHPAFALEDESYNSYSLTFDKNETLEIWPLNIDGTVKTTPLLLQDDGMRISLKKELFYNDALVFKNLNSETIRLSSNETQRGLVYNIAEFPYLGIWAAKDAPFVCIEPWCGIADHENHNRDIMTKEGIMILEPSKTDTKTWWVEFF